MPGELLRQARKAASREDYSAARDLYAEALARPGRENDLDLQVRYAWSAEKCGDTQDAVRVYQNVLQQYQEAGEEAAAESLSAVVDKLLATPAATDASKEDKQESGTDEQKEVMTEQELTDALCGMGRIRQLHKDEPLCECGGPPDALWLLQYGTLRVDIPDYEEPDYLHAGDGVMVLAGEIGVFTRQRRKASLIAENEVGVVEIASAEIYQRCARDHAFAEGLENMVRERWAMPVLSQHSIFNRINDIDRRRLVDAFELKVFEPGQVLVEADCEHDGAYMLQMGCLLYMHSENAVRDDQFETEDGELVTSVLPGDIVHMSGLLQDYISPYRIVCGTPVQALYLSREKFEPFALRRPWIISAILQFSRKPAHLQVMHPEDDYLWKADRELAFTDSK